MGLTSSWNHTLAWWSQWAFTKGFCTIPQSIVKVPTKNRQEAEAKSFEVSVKVKCAWQYIATIKMTRVFSGSNYWDVKNKIMNQFNLKSNTQAKGRLLLQTPRVCTAPAYFGAGPAWGEGQVSFLTPPVHIFHSSDQNALTRWNRNKSITSIPHSVKQKSGHTLGGHRIN